MRAVTPKGAIQKKYDVAEADKTAVFRDGENATKAKSGDNIFLVGLRGSGKSTVGRELAAKLGKTFVDMDDVVEAKAGASIAEIVVESGWPRFRELEREALQEIAATSGQVVATGGGVILDEANRATLKDRGKVFYLMADVGLLASRIMNDPKQAQRPSLTEADGVEEELARTLTEREPLYMQTLDFIVPAEQPLAEIVDSIVEKNAI
jgi:shikimate kinase